jgi:hypothetical protein
VKQNAIGGVQDSNHRSLADNGSAALLDKLKRFTDEKVQINKVNP